jgi:hypothetical protein
LRDRGKQYVYVAAVPPELDITFLNVFYKLLTKLEACKYIQESVPVRNEGNVELLKCTDPPAFRYAHAYRLRYRYGSQTYVHNVWEILLIV